MPIISRTSLNVCIATFTGLAITMSQDFVHLIRVRGQLLTLFSKWAEIIIDMQGQSGFAIDTTDLSCFALIFNQGQHGRIFIDGVVPGPGYFTQFSVPGVGLGECACGR